MLPRPEQRHRCKLNLLEWAAALYADTLRRLSLDHPERRSLLVNLASAQRLGVARKMKRRTDGSSRAVKQRDRLVDRSDILRPLVRIRNAADRMVYGVALGEVPHGADW